MKRQILRDANSRVIGYVDTDANGRQTIQDSDFITRGYFDPTTNETRNAVSQVLGTGNFLVALLPALADARRMSCLCC